MRTNTISIISCLFFAMKATSLPSFELVAKDAALPYPVGVMHWTGSVANGPQIKFNGSIQEVASHLQRTHPEFNLASLIAADSKRDIVEARTPTVWNCDPPVSDATFYAFIGSSIVPIENAIGYLKGVGGTCGCAAHTCCRISCSWDQAVYICNDHDYQLDPACNYLGNPMVQIINDHCQAGVAFFRTVKGKVYDSDSYTITYQGEPADTC